MELRRYLAMTWRWWWLLTLGVVVGSGLAYLISRNQTPIYEATATVLVNKSEAVSPTYNDVLLNQQLTKTYGRLVTSGPVLDQVGQRFDLTYDQLVGMVSASFDRDTQLIDVVVHNESPDLAARIANETAKVFAETIRQQQLGDQGTIEKDIQAQLTAVQALIDGRQQEVARLSTVQPGASPDPVRTQQLGDAQSQLQSLRLNEAELQRRLQDVKIQIAKTVNSLAVADPARVPSTPVSPRTTLNTVLGAFLGLLLISGVVLLMEYMDDTVKTSEDIDQATGAPTLGAVPLFSPKRGRIPGRRATTSRLITSLGPRSTTAEAYRMVRTNLEFARSNRPGHTILITSALPGEGKSTTAANLALLLAGSGRRVILVDADLRKRTLHRMFDVPNASGLSTLFVMEDPQLHGLLRATAQENLLLLPSGPSPPNPAELLASSRMGQIIDLLKAECDVVIFDSPPLLSVADTAGLAPSLDGVVLVVNAGRTRMSGLVQAVEVLGRAGATLWGVVLNKLKLNRADGYYYGYPYYGSYETRESDKTEEPPRAAVRALNGHAAGEAMTLNGTNGHGDAHSPAQTKRGD
jgi:capsular exopolysaccharide synthesis family protein